MFMLIFQPIATHKEEQSHNIRTSPPEILEKEVGIMKIHMPDDDGKRKQCFQYIATLFGQCKTLVQVEAANEQH